MIGMNNIAAKVPHILIVEDDAAVLLSLRLTCEAEGWAVLVAQGVAQALALLAERRPDVIVLDLMLPGGSGYEVARRVRERDARLPIIMLTALTDEADKIRGLDSGADDYVTKPYSPRELAARIRAQLRKSAAFVPVATGDKLTIEPGLPLAHRGGEAIALTVTEWAIARYLAAAGRLVSRDEVVQAVWQYPAGEGATRLLDAHIRNLRAKLGKDAIKTQRGHGYQLVGKLGE